MSLSVVATLEKNRLSSPGAYIPLVEIQIGETVIRLAANNEDIEWDGHTWTRFPLDLDDRMEDGKEMPSLGIKASNALRILQSYIEAADGAPGAAVIVRVVNSLHLDLPADIEETYANAKVSCDDQWVYITLGAENPVAIRFPTDRNLTDFCRFLLSTGFKGIECGATVGDVCDGTLEACRGHGNSVRFGGEAGLSRRGYYV